MVAVGTRGRLPAETPAWGDRRVFGLISALASRRASLAREVASRAREAESTASSEELAAAFEALAPVSEALAAALQAAAEAQAADGVFCLAAVSTSARSHFSEAAPKASVVAKDRSAATTSVWSSAERSTAIPWPDPQAYIAHRKRQTHSAHHGHRLPDVGKGSGLGHATFDCLSDNRVHRHPRVGDSSAARDNSHRRAGDRDHRRPRVGGDSAGHDGRSRRGLGADNGSGASRRNGVGSRGSRGKEKESSSDGRSRINLSRGDVSRASSSSSSTDGSRRALVPEITDITSKRQVLPSLLMLLLPLRFLAA